MRRSDAGARPRPSGSDAPGEPAAGRPTIPAWIVVSIGVAALAGTIAGFTSLDHCRTIACDFTTFHRQGQILLEPRFRLAPGWRLPPFAAITFVPFGVLRLETATVVWEALNLALAGVAAWMCARVLTGYGRARGIVGAALVVSSLPVVHCIKWGQVSLVVAIGAIAALSARRGTGIGLGALAAFKGYPLGFVVGPLAQRRWRAAASALAWTIVLGAAVPLVLLGPERTMTLARNLMSSIPGAGDWENERSLAYYGGQAITASMDRWFRDGGHVGLNEASAPPRVATLPGALALGTAASIAILIATLFRLTRRDLTPPRSVALCLVGVQLIVPPGWHHYFAFLPYAQAVALGDPAPGWRGVASVASIVIAAIPLALLPIVDHAYFLYSAWGGTTVSALLAWTALVASPRLPDAVEAHALQPQPGVATPTRGRRR